MKITQIIDLIEEKANREKCIYIASYSEAYCEPKNFDDYVCFINTNNLDLIQIVKNIIEFVKKCTNRFEFEFTDEFIDNEAQFQIDGYKNIVIKNLDTTFNIDFSNIEKILYDELIKNNFKTDSVLFE